MRLLLIVLLGVVGAARCEDEIKNKPNLLQLAISLNLTKFVEEIKMAGIDKIINHEGKFTVFAPTDEAFAHEKCYPSEASLKDKLRFHVAWGAFRAKEITNEKTVKTLLPKRRVRLNVYNKGQVVTANGRQIVSEDHEAHNGIIHIISDVMSSVYDREGSVVSEIDECCPHHSRVMELIKKAGLYPVLNRRGPFTFLAPENGAFAKLHPDYINHLIKNETALRLVLLTHVIPGTVYSTGLKNGDMVKTLSGVKLCVQTKTGEVKFGPAKVQLMDVTAGNGAVHTLDTVLFPNMPTHHDSCNQEPDAKVPPAIAYHYKMPHFPNLVTALKELGFSAFAKALQSADLLPAVENQEHTTVFAPSNSAVEAREEEIESADEFQDYVKSHITPTLIRGNNFDNDALLDTFQSDRKVRLNVYKNKKGSKYTVNGKEIEFYGHAFDHGIIYKIKDDQDIRVGSQTLLEQMKEDLSLSYFLTLVEDAGLEDLFQQTHYPWTVFAPTNRALEKVFATGLKTPIPNLVLNHILPNTLHETAIRSSTGIFTARGNELKWQIADDGRIFLDGVEVLKAGEKPAVNGVLFKVDELL